LYAFVGDIPVWAQLRTSDHSAAEGVVPALEKIVAAIRKRCRKARILVRGDSGFGREEIMAWCEGQEPVVYCCLGLAKNSVLIEKLARALADARARRCLSGAASVRVFSEFAYRTQTSWSRCRRVVGKAEVMAAGDNPRFVVTNLPAEGFKGDEDRERPLPQRLYEELYCARGDMENQLKQQVLDLRADRLPGPALHALRDTRNASEGQVAGGAAAMNSTQTTAAHSGQPNPCQPWARLASAQNAYTRERAYAQKQSRAFCAGCLVGNHGRHFTRWRGRFR
jgi:hypothetical protein